MKKEEYLESISKKLGITKVLTNQVINAFLDELKEELALNDTVNISNFGIFKKTLITPKVIFSPIDGSKFDVKNYYRVSFTCSKNFLDYIREKNNN